jgi:hypothetical protein
MSRFDATLTIRVPAALASLAASIGRAMDPDVGGAESFRDDADNADTLICTTPCRAEFKAQALAMLSNPALLYHAVTDDYARRWPELPPPTLEDCEQFVAAAVVDQPIVEQAP